MVASGVSVMGAPGELAALSVACALNPIKNVRQAQNIQNCFISYVWWIPMVVDFSAIKVTRNIWMFAMQFACFHLRLFSSVRGEGHFRVVLSVVASRSTQRVLYA